MPLSSGSWLQMMPSLICSRSQNILYSPTLFTILPHASPPMPPAPPLVLFSPGHQQWVIAHSFLFHTVVPSRIEIQHLQQEAFAAYTTIQHFLHFLECQEYHFLINHKFLTYAIVSKNYSCVTWATSCNSLRTNTIPRELTTWLLMTSLNTLIVLFSTNLGSNNYYMAAVAQ